MSVLKQVRDFALRGSAIGLAFGAIASAVLGAIVSSLKDDVLMPVVGLIVRWVDLSNMFLVLGNPNSVAVSSPVSTRVAARAA